MNRLTKRTANGIAYMAIAETLTKGEQIIEGSPPILEGLYAMFQKLADFEDAAEIGMDFAKYQQAAERTAGNLEARNRYLNFSMGLAGEAGEVVDYLKKVLWHGHEMDQDKLKKELGDVLWYVATIATTADLDLSEIAIANIEKLKKRYPEGFDEEKSIKRTE